MGRVTITPIYTAGWSKAMVEASPIHADDDHAPMNETEDRGRGQRLSDVDDPTGFRYNVYERPRAGCGVRVTTRMLHQSRLPELHR